MDLIMVIGTDKRSEIKGKIWVRENKDLWTCEGWTIRLTDEKVKSDIRNGYLKPFEAKPDPSKKSHIAKFAIMAIMSLPDSHEVSAVWDYEEGKYSVQYFKGDIEHKYYVMLEGGCFVIWQIKGGRLRNHEHDPIISYLELESCVQIVQDFSADEPESVRTFKIEE